MNFISIKLFLDKVTENCGTEPNSPTSFCHLTILCHLTRKYLVNAQLTGVAFLALHPRRLGISLAVA